MERTPSAKLDKMLNLEKSAFDRTGLGYDFSSPSIASTSTTVFVSPANNVESKNNDVKIVLASENIDKGKSILGLRREVLKNLNRRSNISVIAVEQLDILDQIAISG